MNLRQASKVFGFAVTLILLFQDTPATIAQQKQQTTGRPLLTQRITRRDGQRLGYGGTVTIVGPPRGSITIEAWSSREVDVIAEIELQAETQEDLNRLATVNGFVFDEDLNHLRILTMGTHDKNFMRRAGKGFPKKLIGLPWKVDYRIRVPIATDLEIDAGRGPINISGVQGALRISAAESAAALSLSAGTVNGTIAAGNVKLRIPVRSWRGAGAELRLAAGNLEVELAGGFNGEIDAEILRSGGIEDKFGLQPRMRNGITATSVKARAGAGGAYFHFVVGDGNIRISKIDDSQISN